MYNSASSLMAFYRVALDKTYDYLSNTKQTSTTERVGTSPSYWTQITTFLASPTHVIDNIYIGSAYNAACYSTLKNLGIEVIMNITTEISEYFPNNFIYKTYKIYDNNQEDISQYLDDAYNYIEENKDKKILIHCYMGASRSASIVMHYLIKKYNMTVDEAYNKLKEKRLIVNPSKKFAENLHESTLMQ